jgi:hypothetical protein
VPGLNPKYASQRYKAETDVSFATGCKQQEYTRDWVSDVYSFTLVHICLVSHQDLIHIVRCMLLDVPDPVSNIWCQLSHGYIIIFLFSL